MPHFQAVHSHVTFLPNETGLFQYTTLKFAYEFYNRWQNIEHLLLFGKGYNVLWQIGAVLGQILTAKIVRCNVCNKKNFGRLLVFLRVQNYKS